jgi:hypothetical protein
MLEPLPFKDFEWYKNLTLNVLSVLDDYNGYIYEVDVDYPIEFHNKHNNLGTILPQNLVHQVLKQ